MSGVNRKDLFVVGVMLAVTILLATALVLVSSPRQRDTLMSMSCSSYSTQARGLKALYRGLTQAGYRTQRFQKPLTRLSAPGVLLIVQPDEALTVRELAALRRWVSRGNTLILAASIYGSDEAASPMTTGGGSAMAGGFGERTNPLNPSFPSPLLDGVQRLSEADGSRIVEQKWAVLRRNWNAANLREEPILRLAGDDGGTAAGMTALGRGVIYLLSVPSVMGNKWLGASDNIRFVLNLIGPKTAGRYVIFDEFHHGYHDMAQEPLFSRFTWFGVWQALVALALWLIFRAVRFGQIRPPVRRPRERTEYVSALARLLGKADAHELARRTLGARFLQELSRELGAAPSASAENLARRAERRGADAERVKALVDAARHEGAADRPGEALRLAQQWQGTIQKIKHTGGRLREQ